MGQVWLACDEETGLDVALKIVAREGKAAERAEREARAAAALRHPRCQRIYALARDPGHVYISYEYIPGKTLRQALAAGELDDRGAVEVAAQVLEARARAHGRGIIHRDVKPSNILLADGPRIDARLLDFGLAQMAEFDSLTAIGDVPGTLGYISPERLLGKSASFSADTWAVGVMLWEALAGSHPFREGGIKDTSRRIQGGAPPLESVRPDAFPPRALQRNRTASALTLNPARRPEAGVLAGELRSLTRKRGQKNAACNPRRESSPRIRILELDPGPRASLPARAPSRRLGSRQSLPFYPAGFPIGLAAIAAMLAFAAPRAGLAFAFVARVFPAREHISLPGSSAILFAALAVPAGWRSPGTTRARACSCSPGRSWRPSADSARSHSRRSSREAACGAPSRQARRCCSQRSSLASGTTGCRSTGRRRRSDWESPAARARARSPTRSGVRCLRILTSSPAPSPSPRPARSFRASAAAGPGPLPSSPPPSLPRSPSSHLRPRFSHSPAPRGSPPPCWGFLHPET